MVLAVSSYELLLRTKYAAEMQDNGDTPVQVVKSMRDIADDLGIDSLSEDEKICSSDTLLLARGSARCKW